jgi:glycosyltransferase involved in cell wall biosynthesis
LHILMEYNKIAENEQIGKKRVAIDLRALNYPIVTGINVYCLHFLQEALALKRKTDQISFVGLGLAKDRLAILSQNPNFPADLFDEHLSLPDYLKTPLKNLKLQNIGMAWFSYWLGLYNFTQLPKFDYLFLIQPKPLWKHPQTRQVTIFHDIYSTLESKVTNVFNRFYVSRKLYQLLASQSQEIWSVSLSTAVDLERFLQVPGNKIKLVYPGRPQLDTPKNLLVSGEPGSRQTSNNSQRQHEFSDSIASKRILDTDQDHGSDRLKLPAKYVLALSGVERRKNWHNLLLAHNYLQNSKNLDYTLVLAGRVVDRGYYVELLRLIEKLQIPRVVWQLDPDENQKLELISRSLFLAYPSFYEGFGFPVLEAFAQGKTILTSRVSSLPEIGRGAALYVNPLNYLDLARGLETLLTNSQLTQRLEESAVKALAKHADWREIRQRLAKIWQIQLD